MVRLHATEFRGTEGSTAAEQWLKALRHHFHTLTCTKHEQVKLALDLLVVEAQDWWDEMVDYHGQPALDMMTWAEFLVVFREQIMSAYEKSNLWDQYKALVQGSMSVAQY